MASNETVVSLQTKLVPSATIVLEDLQSLSEDDLKVEMQKHMQNIVTFQGDVDISPDQVACVSDFASVAFVLSNLLVENTSTGTKYILVEN